MTASEYTVSDYLLDRLVELGIGHVFGVPGDYTLSLLDHVDTHPDLSWVGCANELNAGYAADGYGRMRGFAAVLTTFGVGELSAINAIAGSYAERVPVVHVVGAPASGAQQAGRIVHHSLGDGQFTHFLDMHVDITCARAALTSAKATNEIDRVLAEVGEKRLPGYLLLPSDVGDLSCARPSRPLPAPPKVTDLVSLGEFVEAARLLISSAGPSEPISALVGVLVHRLGATAEMRELLAAGPINYATTLWGKSVVGETEPGFVGVYAGAASDDFARDAVENAAVLIVAGVEFTDLNSGFFTQRINRGQTVELGLNVASVGSSVFAPVDMASALRELTRVIAARSRDSAPFTPPAQPTEAASTGDATDTPALSQIELWQQVSAYLRPGDIVLADQGTSFYGMATHWLPDDVTFIGQPLWASIGYTLPALLGACLASPPRRGVLLIGDGAAQMTVQELSTILRLGLAPTIVIVDNDGYTVERAIHGPNAAYNDIARWEWAKLPSILGPDSSAQGFKVSTADQLHQALQAAQSDPEHLTLIQAVVPRLDVPDLLSMLARAASAANRR